MNTPTLILTPVRAAAPAAGGTFDVLVRLQAPEQPPAAVATSRPPLRLALRLALVIDRSGSMDGAPLREALRCAEHIAAGLTPRDQLAVVLYDDRVQVPLPLTAGGDLAAVRRALAGVESGGSTALFDGWERGARLLEHGPAGSLSRVVLLSDGQANHGVTDADAIARHCATWAAKGVTTTTVGLGRHFNEDLMIGMARAGSGQHYFGQTAGDLRDGFEQELQLLQALCLRQVRVRLVPAAGVVAEPLGLLAPVPAGQSVPLSDLAWGAETWLMVRLHLAAAPPGDPRELHALLAVQAEAQALDGAAPMQLHALLQLPRLAAGDWAGLPGDETVRARAQEVGFAATIAQAQALVAQSQLQQARALLASLQQQVAAHPWLAAKVRSLQQLLDQDAVMWRKEASYSAHNAVQRLASVHEITASWDGNAAADLPAFLQRKAEQGKGGGVRAERDAAPGRDEKHAAHQAPPVRNS